MEITKSYSREQYVHDAAHYPLTDIWNAIMDYMKEHGETEFLMIDTLGDLYELGLSIKDKDAKKKSGVYYTPKDVSRLMAEYYIDKLVPGGNICDVCAGTGNLVLSVLSEMTSRQRRRYFNEERIYLYDLDELALKIAVFRIGYLFGYKYAEKIHVIAGDFLDKAVSLPKRSVVISNPPYFKIDDIRPEWEETDLLKESREFYGVFMEKCIRQAVCCVFITPYSFVGGSKFYSLRKLLNKTRSKIFVFDNVPGNIFRGKKHGVFNSNTANATRAAISIIDTRRSKGAVVSPMIRFSTAERSRILSRDVLDKTLSENNYQKVSPSDRIYYKCFPEDIEPFLNWRSNKDKFESLLSNEVTDYRLDVPTTCRYFTAATRRSLERDGKYVLYFRDEDSMNYAYALLNSSFAYWYWRVYDGAITYPISLMNSMPVNLAELSEEEKKHIKDVCDAVAGTEKDHLIYKKNANKMQENVKFAEEQREMLTHLMSDILKIGPVDFQKIHSNTFFLEDDDSELKNITPVTTCPHASNLQAV